MHARLLPLQRGLHLRGGDKVSVAREGEREHGGVVGVELEGNRLQHALRARLHQLEAVAQALHVLDRALHVVSV